MNTISIETEEKIWKGTSSQWVNFNFYFLCVLLAIVFGLGILFALWKYFYTKLNVLEITNQRIIEHRGILSKETNELELYRIKDLKLEQPFFLRILGLSNIVLVTTDHSNPLFVIRGIAEGRNIKEKLRVAIERRRDIKGVREIDFK